MLLSTSATALFAQDSSVQKEISELKALINAQNAQIDELRAAVKDQKTETRKTKEAIKVVAERPVAPPPLQYKTPAPAFDKSWTWGVVKFTPGGYIAADSVFRTRNDSSDMGTSFTGIPTLNSPLAHMNEQRFSARGSRLSLLAEAPVSPSMFVTGYYEMDFNGGGTTSNYTQTDGWTPRIRQAFVNADYLDSGWHVLAGQAYSLVTTNTKGITPRNEDIPLVIENNDVAGFAYARQPGIRITKDFDKTWWFALSAEESATTFGGTGCNNVVANSSALPAASATNFGAATGVAGISCLATGASGYGQTGQNQQLSINQMPDIVGKVAYEGKVGDRDIHIEAFGAYRNFYDRVNYGALTAAGFAGGSTNQSTSGYGVGGAIVATLIPKLLDFHFSGLYGEGMGRYGSTTLPDATLATNGAITPLKNIDLFGGLVLHATPQIDAYLYGGIEKTAAAYGLGGATATNPGGYIGYGVPTLSNAGCNIEGGTCAGVTGDIWEVTTGLWDKLYEGPWGNIRVGAQYQYVRRDLLPGLGGLKASTDDNIVMTSLRYYPF
ncbi:hypothetical protein UP09_05600 [Bradyrhizobium sp. LTSP885]|nr:hypothetical protein UP09_05600 [Bradyrhizobium sp. LTSP885]